MIFLTFVIFLILTILLVSLITYFNSKNETNVVTEKGKIISEIKVNTNFDPTTYIGLQGKGVINWGDGTSESFNAKNISTLSHNYPSSGDYTLIIEGEIISCLFRSGVQGGGVGPNIINYNIELINTKKLQQLIMQFASKNGGNEKYFLEGLETCEALTLLSLSEPQNIINLPNSNKLVDLIIFNSTNNYITEINNLLSQVDLQNLELRNIPTDVYIASDIFDTTIFSSLSELVLLTSNSSLENLILNNNIIKLILEDLIVTNIDNLNYNNYESFFIRNVDYFDNFTELNFSNNTIISELSYSVNNSGNVNLILPTTKTTLTYLEFTPDNSGNNTISDVNEYTNLNVLSLGNLTIPSDILAISNLDKLTFLGASSCGLTDITLSTSISNLYYINIKNNSIQTSELNAIGQVILTQCNTYNITNGIIEVAGNPGTINLASSPWIDLTDTYFWTINV